MSRRSSRIAAVAFGAFVFLGIALLLARALTATGQERSLVLEVLRAQARGDAAEVLRRLPACAQLPACADTTRRLVDRLERRGEVEILSFRPSVRVALTRMSGTARVAWRIEDGARPVVQCVRVRREGPLTGGRVELLAVSAPIGSESPCPR